jgi:hypothetical protein
MQAESLAFLSMSPFLTRRLVFGLTKLTFIFDRYFQELMGPPHRIPIAHLSSLCYRVGILLFRLRNSQ